MIGQQLTLAVQLPQTADFDSFIYRGDDPAVATLRAGEAAYLVGPPAAGKTHLLMAAVRCHGGAYLPLSELGQHGPERLDGLGATGALALDELESLPADPVVWQTLLRLLDRRRQAGDVTWLAARLPPDQLHAAPPDLRTRLALWPRFGLMPLDESGQRRLLAQAAMRRGLTLSDEVISWWLRHLPRDAASLQSALSQLDRAALREQRRPTLPFVQSVLGRP